MNALGKDGRDQHAGHWPDLLGPANHPARRPLEMLLMGLGHVRRLGGEVAADHAAAMRGDPLAVAVDLHGGAGHAGLQGLVHERVVDGVVVGLDVDVVVDVHFHLGPERHLVAACGQRLESQAVERLE